MKTSIAFLALGTLTWAAISLAEPAKSDNTQSSAQAASEPGTRARAGERRRRGALSGPASRPSGEAGEGDAQRNRAPMFQMLDQNHDGKLQPNEIGRLITVLKEAQDASQKADLSPEEWSRYAEQLRPRAGKARGQKRVKP